MIPKIKTRQKRHAIVSAADIRDNGTLTPEAREFLGKVLPNVAHEFTVATRPRGDVRITIIFETEAPA